MILNTIAVWQTGRKVLQAGSRDLHVPACEAQQAAMTNAASDADCGASLARGEQATSAHHWPGQFAEGNT